MSNAKQKLTKYFFRELEDDIVREYKKFGVKIDIKERKVMKDRVILFINLKGNSLEDRLRARAPDVQQRLELPLFCVVKSGFSLEIVASWIKIDYPHLPAILKSPNLQTILKKRELPYVVGFNALGEAVIEDLAKFPHLLLGGSTNSGKTVGLKSLITNIAYTRSPSEANFVIIDVGATNLQAFNDIPHLSYPIVQDRTTAMGVLKALIVEMERRAKLEDSTSLHYAFMPRLVVVIDEFPALFSGMDKAEIRELSGDISALLERGRHAKMNFILAAQNPAFHKMKVGMENIAGCVAFRCIKKNFSEIILGEGGAEKLLGNGDLLLKSPNSNIQRLQGSFITPEEIKEIVPQIIEMYKHSRRDFCFAIPADMIEVPSLAVCPTHPVVKNCPSEDDRLFARVILRTLEKNSISANLIKTEFHLGWDRAANLVKRLEQLGMVEERNGKQARNVRPQHIGDLSEELLKFLAYCGYPRDSIIRAFQKRAASHSTSITNFSEVF